MKEKAEEMFYKWWDSMPHKADRNGIVFDVAYAAYMQAASDFCNEYEAIEMIEDSRHSSTSGV